MALTRRAYLVIFVVLVVILAATSLYLRQRAARAAALRQPVPCDTPAPPPKPATPPPKLPDFAIETACGPGETQAPKKK